MAHIIYNVVPNHPTDDKRIHWLVSLVEGYRSQTKSEHTVRVSRETIDNWVAYTIRNVTSKIKIVASGEGDKVTLKFYQLTAPQIDKIAPPRYGQPYAEFTFSLSNSTGMGDATKALTAALDAPTAYTLQDYPRIKYRISPIFDKHIFQGGQIAEYAFDEKTGMTTVMLESSEKKRMGVMFSKPINGHRAHEAMRGLTLVIDEMDEVVVLSSDNHWRYYEEVKVEH